MAHFDPDLVAPHDPAGWGRWLMGNYLEHRQIIAIGRTATPPINIPDYPIAQWSDDPGPVAIWRNVHKLMHDASERPFGISGIDLSIVDFSDGEAFEIWLQDHRTRHQLLRQAYGIA